MASIAAEEIESWHRSVFAACPDTDRYLRACALRRGRSLGDAYIRTWQRLAAFAQWAVEEGADCYAGVLLRDEMSRKAKAVHARDAVFADVDVGKPGMWQTLGAAYEALHASGLPTTTTSESGGGLHVRTQLTRSLPHDEWSQHQLRYNLRLGGDLAAIDPGRLHRVPGTWNFKLAEPRRVRLISTAPPVTPEDLARALGPAIELQSSQPSRVLMAAPPRIVRRNARFHSGRPFDLANDVPVRAVLAALGVHHFVREGARTYCNCPACPGEDDREMVVGGTANVATCFGDCGRHYTAVNLVAAVRRCTPREAVDWLSERFGFWGFPAEARR